MYDKESPINRKQLYIGSTVAAVVVVLLIGIYLLPLISIWLIDPEEITFFEMLLLGIIPAVAVIIGVLVALRRRFREIKGGELDASRKY